MRTEPQTYTKAEMRRAIALVRNAAEQLADQGYTATITPTDVVLADMLELLLEMERSAS
jgi:hypothetical protein